MPVRSFVPIPGFFWIPPESSTIYKITVTRSDGTVDDITDLVHSCKIEDGVTETIGRFEFEIWDPNENYRVAWTGNEIFRYYSDYSTTATTKRFQGKVERVSKQGMKLKVNGRSDSLYFMDITVTQSFSNTACNSILSTLISTYSSGFTTVNINTSTTNLTVNWYQKPFFECVQELCKAANFDFYIDNNKDVHFFAVNLVNNSTEAIVQGINMMEIGEFSNDLSLIKNRVIVYGAEQAGTQIIYTADDTTSQGLYGIKEVIINDSNITNYQQAVDLATAKLAELKNPPQIGEVKGVLLASLQPGERIQLSSQEEGIDPQYYDIISFEHDIIRFMTTVRVSKEPRKISHIFKSIIERQSQKQDTFINPYEMKFSYTFLFDSDEGTHTNTQITNGVLKLQVGQTSGNWVSTSRTTTSSVTKAYLVVIGETLTGATYQVSADGTNYQSITNKAQITLSSTGTSLSIRVTINDSGTAIYSLSLLYRYT